VLSLSFINLLVLSLKAIEKNKATPKIKNIPNNKAKAQMDQLIYLDTLYSQKDNLLLKSLNQLEQKYNLAANQDKLVFELQISKGEDL